MCMEDIRIGRDGGGTSRIVNLSSSTAGQICSADPKRVTLIVSGAENADIYIGPLGFPLSPGSGFKIPQQANPFVMRIEEWGSILREPWFAVQDVSTISLAVAEVTLEKT